MSPPFVPPQLPTLAPAPPAGDGWVHEIKRDGFRTLIRLDKGEARIFTRSGYDWTKRYGSFPKYCQKLAKRPALLDGEMLIQRPDGTCDFAAMQDAVGCGRGAFVFFAFDLLHLGGQDLRRRPLLERKAMLAELLGEAAADRRFPIRYSDHVAGDGASVFRHAHRLGLEGIVSKRAAGRYRSGRSREWLKVKNFERSDLVVIGRVHDVGRPEELLLAERGEGGLRYAGRAFNTLRQPDRDHLAAAIDRDARLSPPIAGLKARDCTWTEPRHRVTVRHLATSGALRHATVEAWVRP
jgi:bifunctional non-homologous end joining protein LigD